jgi:UDP-N-acetyl-D-glucosamine dehydrogenase
MPTDLQQKLTEKSAIVGIIGLGYVGLPLVRAFIDAGFRSLGFDVDQKKIAQLLEGKSYIGHIPESWIASCVEQDKFEPTSDMHRLGEADVLLICVPTPLSESRDPDLQYVQSTTQHIATHLRPGQLVVLESTTYPGTTRDVLLPILLDQQDPASNLEPGHDFFLAYSPEREDPGNPDFATATIPKVVGANDETSLRLACQLYESIVPAVVPVTSTEVAEACKILENTYRAVNIALVNELKKLLTRMDIDVWEVIDAAKTKPFGFQAFYPGPGLGGHCIPIDPFYLSWAARLHGMSTRFIELAGEVNAGMPEYVIEQLSRALNAQGKPIKGSRICLLGVAYKPDVDDPRESPSFELMKLLLARGAELTYNDPHVPSLPTMRQYETLPLKSTELTPEFLSSQDCILISTNHSTYDYKFIVQHAQLVVDTRGATRDVTDGQQKIWPA